MPAFTDRTGQTWTFDLTVGALRRVRSLVRADDGKPFDVLRLIDDPERALRLAVDEQVLLGETLYACIEPKANGLSREAFLERLDGESLLAGLHALLEGVVSFSRTPELRRALEWLPTAITTGVKEIEMRRALAMQPGRATPPEPGSSSGAAPESSASIPTA